MRPTSRNWKSLGMNGVEGPAYVCDFWDLGLHVGEQVVGVWVEHATCCGGQGERGRCTALCGEISSRVQSAT